MTYVISDIHGNYQKFKELMDNVLINDSDTLYILGDTVDFGDGGQFAHDALDLLYHGDVAAVHGDGTNHAVLFGNAGKEVRLMRGDARGLFHHHGEPCIHAIGCRTEEAVGLNEDIDAVKLLLGNHLVHIPIGFLDPEFLGGRHRRALCAAHG